VINASDPDKNRCPSGSVDIHPKTPDAKLGQKRGRGLRSSDAFKQADITFRRWHIGACYQIKRGMSMESQIELGIRRHQRACRHQDGEVCRRCRLPQRGNGVGEDLQSLQRRLHQYHRDFKKNFAMSIHGWASCCTFAKSAKERRTAIFKIANVNENATK